MAPSVVMTLHGTLVLSDPFAQRTVGMFNTLIEENAPVFRRHFGVDLFPGSLNVNIPPPGELAQRLDAGEPPPSIVTPRAELVNQPYYIGDGQAWPCQLSSARFSNHVNCWIFRRIGSRVNAGIIEVVATVKLRTAYHLQHADPVVIEMLTRHATPAAA